MLDRLSVLEIEDYGDSGNWTLIVGWIEITLPNLRFNTLFFSSKMFNLCIPFTGEQKQIVPVNIILEYFLCNWVPSRAVPISGNTPASSSLRTTLTINKALLQHNWVGFCWGFHKEIKQICIIDWSWDGSCKRCTPAGVLGKGLFCWQLNCIKTRRKM